MRVRPIVYVLSAISLLVPVAASAAWLSSVPDPPTLAPGAEERLLVDLADLAGKGLLAGRGTQRNAASLLNPLVASDLPADGRTLAWWADGAALAALRELPDDEWLDHPELTADRDVSLLTELRAYDHWAWGASDPFAAHAAANPDECAFTAPRPVLPPFVDLARVRLAQGYARGDLPEAAADVEHLAMLVASTDLLLGTAVGGAILRMEDTALRRAAAEGRPVPSRGWTAEDLDKLVPATTAAAAVIARDPGSELALRMVERSAELPGVCAGLVEAVGEVGLLRGLAGSPWPGEGDYGDVVRGLDAALASSSCSLVEARRRWAVADESTCGESPDRAWPEEAVLSVPYLRMPYLNLVRRIVAIGVPEAYGAPES